MAESSSTALSVPATGSSLGFLENAITTFEGVERLAACMAKCGTLPQHLQGKPSDCFRIVVQAAKWRMDPFAVAECTSLVHGRMCYEGKLVAAVLQAMGAIEGRLTYEITGKGQDASIVVTGTPKGAKKPASLSGSVKEWRTTHNGSPWEKQPETMLVYRGTRQWARLYAPEAILGVYTPDEAEEIRTVEATVVGTDLPQPEAARTAATTAESKPADAPPPQQPTNTPPAPAKPPEHPALAAGLKLMGDLTTAKLDGRKILVRLAALHGAKVPSQIAPENLDQFGKDVAELKACLGNPAELEAKLAEWERMQAQEGGAK